MPDQAWQFIYARTKKVVQRLKDNGSFTLNAKFGNGRLQAAFGEFFKSFLRLPYLNDPETGFRGWEICWYIPGSGRASTPISSSIARNSLWVKPVTFIVIT